MAETVFQISPPEVWPLACYLAEEMQARGWKATDVAIRMRGDYSRNVIVVNLILAVQDPKMVLDDHLLGNLAGAFGVSREMFQRLHRKWLRWPGARQSFECPEEILDGLLIPANDPLPHNKDSQA